MRSEDVELGHLVLPEEGTHPGVVMIHDVWGLSDHTRDLAARLAAEGFAVLAIDLYRRMPDFEITDPGVWMRGLSDPQAIADVQAGVDFLAGRPETAGQGIGITGFCMGGMYALFGACACSGVSAAVPYYGLLSHDHGILHDEAGLDPTLKPRRPLDYAPDLRCPLLAFFGDEDTFIPVSDVRALEAGLAGTPHEAEVVLYEGAGHAFMNDTRPEAFRPEIAREAWQRTIAFFRARLTR
jgi:carboxymethylenebutenolidase